VGHCWQLPKENPAEKEQNLANPPYAALLTALEGPRNVAPAGPINKRTLLTTHCGFSSVQRIGRQ